TFTNKFEKVTQDLERDSKPPIDLGKCGPFTVGRSTTVFEQVKCESPFVVDAQALALIFTTRQGELRSVDNKLGRANWKGPKGEDIAVKIGDYGDPTPGPEVLPGRAIFTAGCDGIIRAMDANSGAVVWQQGVGSPIAARPRLTSDGFGLVVGTLNGDIIM